MDYLPVFLRLADRPVLVVGGGLVALRKVELLLKAHARVRVVAPRLTAELALYRDAARIEHVAAAFESDHFDDVVLAIAATDRREVNAAVAAEGLRRGVFVNVVDDAELSSGVMPAIIDRSPLVVAVASSGQAPSLARRVRAQIEALLPERLGELARFTGRIRERVQRALPDLQQRRRFYDRLLSGPIATQLLAGRVAEAEAMLSKELVGDAPRGEVYLIGAGPGDPDLLTVRAQQLLQQVDVVLYDRLVSEAVLERVRRDARRVFVGKESGRHRVTQERIHALLLEYAGAGLRVARLKGGDPFIFGRGGEELDVLLAAGIPVVIVPGITAALGAAAAAGLPLTRRGLAQAVTFVTAVGEGAESLDWRSLAAPLQTVVFYMGVAQLPRIIEALRAHGAPASRPASIVERATLPSQRLIGGRIENILERAAAASVQAPALLIVGEAATRVAEVTTVLEESRNMGKTGL